MINIVWLFSAASSQVTDVIPVSVSAQAESYITKILIELPKTVGR